MGLGGRGGVLPPFPKSLGGNTPFTLPPLPTLLHEWPI